jgi:hypothetical protein
MQKFTADTFYAIGTYLALHKQAVERQIAESSRDKKLSGESPLEKTPQGKVLTQIKTNCLTIGLTVSVKAVDHLMESVVHGTTLGYYLDILGQLERTISWEMGDRLFMFVPPERASFYDNKELLGKDVNAKFPSIQFDAVEAGNCYAAGRGTAVVFHLMRIMEVGVQSFGTKLGVPLADEKNWQNILDEVNKKIKALPPKDASTVKLSQASANLYSVKLAWRNEVMHPKDTYTLEEADTLIRQVRIFIEHLATIV